MTLFCHFKGCDRLCFSFLISTSFSGILSYSSFCEILCRFFSLSVIISSLNRSIFVSFSHLVVVFLLDCSLFFPCHFYCSSLFYSSFCFLLCFCWFFILYLFALIYALMLLLWPSQQLSFYLIKGFIVFGCRFFCTSAVTAIHCGFLLFHGQ